MIKRGLWILPECHKNPNIEERRKVQWEKQKIYS